VVLDLVRKAARLEGEDPEPDPASWYRQKFGKDPDYGNLLKRVVRSPAERSALLRAYFEPTEEEREQHLKVPTAAHEAIADLVARGYIKVIITTNFDRLLERAAESVGVVPTVISSPDAAKGAVPFVHNQCTILKVHGDYLDTRIKNTPQELAKYDKRIDAFLDRVLDELGLIVVGWSADWDTALRAAIERCANHRFSTFWAVRSEPSETAGRLIKLRRAVVVRIADANTFFRTLGEKVFALEEYGRPHPLSAKLAVATIKSYLVDDRHRIHLHDLVMEETERLYASLAENDFPVQTGSASVDELVRRINQYEARSEILQAMLATGCYWGDEKLGSLWARSLERIANPSGGESGLVVWLHLRRYPALVLLYSGGIASVASGRFGTLKTLLLEPKVSDHEEKPAVMAVYPSGVLENGAAQRLPGLERHYTALSDHLHAHLREPLRELLPEDLRYERAFDRFEYLFALVHADLHEKATGRVWGPIGRFGWKFCGAAERTVVMEIEREIDQQGGRWLPLRAGLFDGSLERVREVKSGFDDILRRLHWF
jgi:phosphoserine phosphatase